ncbi:MAG: glycosyltransferase family 2 protein [Candidatus Hydrogenedentes bacterium]|nr:glycosyltransferase family 2 protein [Candidatus Hydrogenedentota bacterium]
MQDETEAPLAATIVIATFNRVTHLEACLESLPWEALDRHRTEVVVVDDGSTDGAKERVQSRFPRAKLVDYGENRGLAHARNAGARAARGRMLLYLDDDAVVQPGWLEAMLAADDGETLLGGRILDFVGDREQGGPAYSTFLGKRLPCKPEQATVGTGCNLGVPRRCLEVLGGFDEDLPYYFEDSDICIRARKAGFRFKYVADGAVRHKGSEIKRGNAIRMQEHNSSFAMLKQYARSPLRLAAFFAGNTAWLLIRVALWLAKGRTADVALLLRGWASAHARFLKRALQR